MKVSGAWKDLTSIGVKVSGAWKTVANAYVKVSGTWKEVFTNAIVAISDASFGDDSTTPIAASATYTLKSDGNIIETTNLLGDIDAGDWITPTSAAGAEYEARATVTSGSLSSGTSGSWLALDTDRSWTRSRAGGSVGTSTCVFDLEIRRASDGTVLDTATITISATVNP